MKNTTQTETERKFLIKFPDTERIGKEQALRIITITQTYLLCSDGSMRVRKQTENGSTKYVRNIKKRISDMSHLENEKEISEETYNELLLCRDSSRSDISKTRYAFPYLGHIMEIDIYPFWQDRAILEIELPDENSEYKTPDFINIIKEVTDDKRYSNKSLAKEIITEQL